VWILARPLCATLPTRRKLREHRTTHAKKDDDFIRPISSDSFCPVPNIHKFMPKQYDRTVRCNKGCDSSRYGPDDSWRGRRCPDCQVCDICSAVRPRVESGPKWHGYMCPACKRGVSKRARVHTFRSWRSKRLAGGRGWGRTEPKKESFVSTDDHDKARSLWLSTRLTFEQWRESIVKRHDKVYTTDPHALPGWGCDPRVRRDFRNKAEQTKAYLLWDVRHRESAGNQPKPQMLEII
jgi:hypothetical protein